MSHDQKPTVVEFDDRAVGVLVPSAKGYVFSSSDTSTSAFDGAYFPSVQKAIRELTRSAKGNG